MNAPTRWSAYLVCLVFRAGMAAGAEPAGGLEDLDVVVRSYPKSIVYADPLYLELRVVNRSEKVVRTFVPDVGNMQFRATDRNFDVSIDCSPNRLHNEDFEMVNYGPGDSRKTYCQIFLPKLDKTDHPFWAGIEVLGGVRLETRFCPGRVHLRGDLTWADIMARDPRELDALRRWSRVDTSRKVEPDTKVSPFVVGIVGLRDVRTRADAKQLAAVVKSGELGELLQLILRLQDLESSDNREAKSRALVEWVAGQPHIKRQWLAGRLSDLRWLFPESALKSLEKLAE